MPMRYVYVKMLAWVPERPELPEFPGFPEWRPPGWGQPLPPWPEGPGGEGERPEFPWIPGTRPPLPRPPEGWEPPEFPGFPERPGQPLPPQRPQTGPWPIVPDDDDGDREGHPPLPDLNMPGRWTTVTMGRAGPVGASWPAWVIDPTREPPMVEEDYEPRHPTKGLPGRWVTCLYHSVLAWAWVPDVEGEEGGEDGEDGGEAEGRRARARG